MRACLRLIGFLLLTLGPLAMGAESPASVFEHTRSVYAALTSYSDTGTVTYQYAPTAGDTYSFTTRFNRGPRHLLFDFHSGNGDHLVIWADPDAFHVWWKATGQTTDYPNPKNTGAITLNAYPTKGAVTQVIPLLYAKAALPGTVAQFEPAGEAATEDVAGTPCFRLSGTSSDTYGSTGKKVNVRSVTVWIDSTTYLIRKIVEDAPSSPGTLNRTTTTFDPKANPQLSDDLFKFAPPR